MKTIDAVRFFQKQRGMNKTSLAKELGISKASVSLWLPIVPVSQALKMLAMSGYQIPFKASDYGKDAKLYAAIAKSMKMTNCQI